MRVETSMLVECCSIFDTIKGIPDAIGKFGQSIVYFFYFLFALVVLFIIYRLYKLFF